MLGLLLISVNQHLCEEAEKTNEGEKRKKIHKNGKLNENKSTRLFMTADDEARSFVYPPITSTRTYTDL